MNDRLLRIEDLSVHYRIGDMLVEAVSGLSLDIAKGESVGLVGETGAGKTTTALAIMRLVPSPPGMIVGGRILFEEEDLLSMNARRIRKVRGKQIAMIFQDPMTSLNPVMRIGDQIAEVVRLHTNMTHAEAAIRAQEMLEMVGIPAKRYNEYPHQFSGGMKQRVVIACGLACNPKLLIADEPTTALDVTIQAQVLELIGDLQKEFNTAMLMITHDLGVVAEVCERVAVMYAGRIVEQGFVSDVYRNPLHPYTLGLFKSLPHLDADVARLEPIPGVMPDPANLPRGCAFCPRCPHSDGICETSRPEGTLAGPGHMVSCHALGMPRREEGL